MSTSEQAQARAFTVAADMDRRTLNTIRALVEMAVSCGLSFAQFQAMACAAGVLPGEARGWEPYPPVDTSVPPGAERQGNVWVSRTPLPDVQVASRSEAALRMAEHFCGQIKKAVADMPDSVRPCEEYVLLLALIAIAGPERARALLAG